MASEKDVRKYLAYWFQLGKQVVVPRTGEKLLPNPVFRGFRYSPEFEECWQKIISSNRRDCYVEGTDETIGELLTSKWELILCGRCAMPIPARTKGMPPEQCPCSDLPNWPNTEVPAPRSPVDTQSHLNSIRRRLSEVEDESETQSHVPTPSPDMPHEILNFPPCACPLHQHAANQ
jgi:hypothetical protein